MMRRRAAVGRGRPGLVGTVARTAVVAGTATATAGAVNRRQERKAMEQQRANEAELKGVLGEAKYREWQEYQALAGVRWESQRLRTSLANAGVPLDESLAKPLMKVLQEQQKLEMQRLQQYAGPGQAAEIEALLAKPGVDGELRAGLEQALKAAKSR